MHKSYQISVEGDGGADPLEEGVVSGLDATVLHLLQAVERLIVDALQLGRLQGRHHHVLGSHQVVDTHGYEDLSKKQTNNKKNFNLNYLYNRCYNLSLII